MTVAIIVAAVLCASLSTRFLSVAELGAVLKEMWIVQAVLATAVVSLIYRLQSDLAAVGHLTPLQRSRLDGMVRVKSRRLWVLFLAITVAGALVRIADPVSSELLKRWLVAGGAGLMVATLLYCFYLPGMWNELRGFVTLLSAEKAADDRRRTELKRLGG
ncbi:hypothetical protein IB242_09280 [Xanthomonas sp. XNM01]|nr:hypothetical protein [Xanthomonas sp. XNM01]